MDRYCGIASMGHGGNDIVRANCGVATKKHFLIGGLKRDLIEYGQFPLVEFDAQVPFNPGQAVLLPDGT